MNISAQEIKRIILGVLEQLQEGQLLVKQTSPPEPEKPRGIVLSPAQSKSTILIKEEDARSAISDGIIYVTADYIVTPSASDIIRDHRLELKRINDTTAQAEKLDTQDKAVKTLAVGSDHRGYSLKKELKKYLTEKGIKVEDVGPDNSERCAFPEYAYKVAQAVVTDVCERGIMVDGTGVGSSIAVNRIAGIRGTLCNDLSSVELARAHNNSNLLILGADIISHNLAQKIVTAWLETKFLGGEYGERLKMLEEFNQQRG